MGARTMVIALIEDPQDMIASAMPRGNGYDRVRWMAILGRTSAIGRKRTLSAEFRKQIKDQTHLYHLLRSI